MSPFRMKTGFFVLLFSFLLFGVGWALDFNPQEIDFGEITETGQLVEYITISNPDPVEVIIASHVGVEGVPGQNNLTQCADLEARISCTSIPANNGSCLMIVTLKPYQECPYNGEEGQAVLYIYSSDTQQQNGWQPYVIPVRATFNLPGNEPAVQVEPTSLDLGEVEVEQSASGSVTVKNNGDGLLRVSAYVDGQELYQNGEVEVDDLCSGLTLPKNATCRVRITYTPNKGAGELSGRLILVTNVEDNPMIEVPITVKAVGEPRVPKLVVETETVDFGRIEYPGERTDMVVIKNDGTAELSISSDFTVTGDDCFEGAQIQPLCDTEHIGPDEYCYLMVKVNFDEGMGECEGSFAIFSNDPDNRVKQVHLRAELVLERVTEEDVVVYPSGGEPTDWYDFENLTIDDEKEQIFYLKNNSSVPISITELLIDHDPVGNFEVSLDTCTSSEIPAGGICVFAVKVHPQMEGMIFSRVIIKYVVPDGEEGEAERLQFFLSAIVQRVSFEAYLKKEDGSRFDGRRYIFETVQIEPREEQQQEEEQTEEAQPEEEGGEKEQETEVQGEKVQVVIENDGEAAISFISVFEYDPAFKVNLEGCPQLEEGGILPLARGETCVIEVTYAPEEPGVHVAIFAVFKGREIFPFILQGMAEEKKTEEAEDGSPIQDDTSGEVISLTEDGKQLVANIPALDGWEDADIFLFVVKGREWWSISSGGDVEKSRKYVVTYYRKDVDLTDGYTINQEIDGLDDVCKPGERCELWVTVAKGVRRLSMSDIFRGDYKVWKTRFILQEQTEENEENLEEVPQE